eukprot:268271-Amphidinium_carterae.2
MAHTAMMPCAGNPLLLIANSGVILKPAGFIKLCNELRRHCFHTCISPPELASRQWLVPALI